MIGSFGWPRQDCPASRGNENHACTATPVRTLAVLPSFSTHHLHCHLQISWLVLAFYCHTLSIFVSLCLSLCLFVSLCVWLYISVSLYLLCLLCLSLIIILISPHLFLWLLELNELVFTASVGYHPGFCHLSLLIVPGIFTTPPVRQGYIFSIVILYPFLLSLSIYSMVLGEKNWIPSFLSFLCPHASFYAHILFLLLFYFSSFVYNFLPIDQAEK